MLYDLKDCLYEVFPRNENFQVRTSNPIHLSNKRCYLWKGPGFILYLLLLIWRGPHPMITIECQALNLRTFIYKLGWIAGLFLFPDFWEWSKINCWKSNLMTIQCQRGFYFPVNVCGNYSIWNELVKGYIKINWFIAQI